MTHNNTNPTLAPAIEQAISAVQPAIVQPMKSDAPKVETFEKK